MWNNAPVAKTWEVVGFSTERLDWYLTSGLFTKTAITCVNVEPFTERLDNSRPVVHHKVARGTVTFSKARRGWSLTLPGRPSAILQHVTSKKHARLLRVHGKSSASKYFPGTRARKCDGSAREASQPVSQQVTAASDVSQQSSSSASFEYLHILDEGVYSSVWMARAKNAEGKLVAMKVAKIQAHGGHQDAVVNTLKEFKWLTALSGEIGVVRGFQCFLALAPYHEAVIVQELCLGSVAKLLEKCRFDHLAPERRCEQVLNMPPIVATRQILQAMAAIHDLDLLHRDVKPANMLLRAGDDPHVVMSDFGDMCTVNYAVRDDSLVQTPYYRAPEVFMGGAATKHADMWPVGPDLSLCCVDLWLECNVRSVSDCFVTQVVWWQSSLDGSIVVNRDGEASTSWNTPMVKASSVAACSWQQIQKRPCSCQLL